MTKIKDLRSILQRDLFLTSLKVLLLYFQNIRDFGR
jgi:hypothetical protein